MVAPGQYHRRILPEANPAEGRLLTRDLILSGAIRKIATERVGSVTLMSDEEREASLKATLAAAPARGPIWVFGYGSLIWNPAFHFVERRVGLLRGYHRRFCLWTQLGRGSPECPGLMLALERGGSCRGVVFRIADDQVATELDVIWRREMLSNAYVPVWAPVRTGAGTVQAITFAINRGHERYAGRLPDETIVDHIARAHGPIGRCCEYLYNTVEHLDQLGIHDRRLRHIAQLVRLRQGTP